METVGRPTDQQTDRDTDGQQQSNKPYLLQKGGGINNTIFSLDRLEKVI